MLNNLKKLLIIQQDDAYFLFETILVLEKNISSLKDFDVTVLVDSKSLSLVESKSVVSGFKLTTNIAEVISQKYDMSFNLSHMEEAWHIHSQVDSITKIGPYYENGRLIVKDNWSSFYLTLKSKAPFLTFHLQDIFKNILGIKRIEKTGQDRPAIKTLAFGFSNPNLLSGHELEELVNELHASYPLMAIRDVSEIDPVEDLSHILYIGPATLDALFLCESGAQGFFLTSQFQGFNLLPYGENHLVVSSRGQSFKAENLVPLIENKIAGSPQPKTTYSLYKLTNEHLFGTYAHAFDKSDDSYPIYQSHVVLWNFLLGLFDTNLEVSHCSPSQLELLKQQEVVLNKLNRLYDYAMSSVDTIHAEARSSEANFEVIQGHLNNLQEIDGISDKISQSHPFIRPILDFYHIRRGQNEGTNLLEQSQHSFLAYSEEHQALKALQELFSVTLNKNEVNI